MASSGPLVVGAIDFGTTFSGWAYSFYHEFRSDPTKSTVKHWYSGSGSVVTEKTPTCALIKPDGETLEAFGYDAENRYCQLVENEEHEDYYYFRRFKMALNKTGRIDTEKLSIAKEPEAASIFCRHLPVEKSGSEATISSLPPGSKYMVLDAGGGTIDITVHQVTKSGGLKEICAASGGGWGGILVDNAFKELLVKLFGEMIYDTFVESMTEDWLELWRTFDSKKKAVDPASSLDINMRLPTSLLKHYKKKTGQKFEDMLENSSYASKISIRGGDKVRFASSLMKDLFHASIEKTVTHVKSILHDDKNTRDVGLILMVGGFSESPMLQNAVKKEFRHLKVIVPREASSSILRGAVAFGHNPKSITQRVLSNTYGIEATETFEEGIHPEHLKKIKDGEVNCYNIFSKHVEIGQSVNVGEAQAEQLYTPIYETQKTVEIDLYVSKLKNPKYTDHGCDCVGKFTVDLSKLPDDLSRKDKKVFVSLTFSGTEITASARVEKTGELTTASFDFLE